MKWPASTSLQQKVGPVLLASVGLALFIAAGALLLVQARKEWRDAHAELSAQAEVVGLASEAALAFRDPAVGEQTLRALVAQPSVLAAALFFSIFPVVFYLLIQRYIVTGLSAGAVKG